MKKSFLFLLAVNVAMMTQMAMGETFTIGGYAFDEKNSVKNVKLYPVTLHDHPAPHFARFSEDYVTSITTKINAFEKFNRGNTIGRLAGRGTTSSKGRDYSRSIRLPDVKEAPPTPDLDRVEIRVGWDTDAGLRNHPGSDFVVFESGIHKGFAVAVKKAGSTTWSKPRYQFANAKDPIHDANILAFDLSDFGIGPDEAITAISIRNIFNSDALTGPDKVSQENGEGTVISAGEPGYDQAYTLREKAGGTEFSTGSLNADIIYVAALHDVETLKAEDLQPPKPPEPEPAPTPAPKASTNKAVVAPKK